MGFRLLPIARPCSESFASMPGGESKRFCSSCDKHVHDLSAGTEEEARALFAANRDRRVCVRFAKDGAGNVRFRAAAMAAALSLAACGSNSVDAVAPSDVVTPMSEAPKPEAVPEGDYDMGDGVPDVQDRCPDDPSPSDIEDGCPEAATDAIDAGK
jgi:hypothetical protein